MCMQVPTYLLCVLSSHSPSSVFDRFLSTSALDSVDAILLRLAHPICRQIPMRQGPTSSPRSSNYRPTPPNGVDPTREGIRALDCGEDMNAPATTIVGRTAPEAVSSPAETEPGDLGEQRQSV